MILLKTTKSKLLNNRAPDQAVGDCFHLYKDFLSRQTYSALPQQQIHMVAHVDFFIKNVMKKSIHDVEVSNDKWQGKQKKWGVT